MGYYIGRTSTLKTEVIPVVVLYYDLHQSTLAIHSTSSDNAPSYSLIFTAIPDSQSQTSSNQARKVVIVMCCCTETTAI